MQPPTHVCTHISVHKTNIEDNKLVCNQLTKNFTIVNNKLLLKQGHRNTIDHGKQVYCIIHHVCQEITMGMMRSCSRWWWRCASPRGRGGDPGGGETARGGVGAPRRRSTLGGGGPLALILPWLGAGVEGLLSLLGGCQGGENSWLWMVPLEIGFPVNIWRLHRGHWI
jgi:hypothetical protein